MLYLQINKMYSAICINVIFAYFINVISINMAYVSNVINVVSTNNKSYLLTV